MLPLEGAERFIALAVNPDAGRSKRHPLPQSGERVQCAPQTILLVAGVLSRNSNDFGDVQQVATRILPLGTITERHQFIGGFNTALIRRPVPPRPLRSLMSAAGSILSAAEHHLPDAPQHLVHATVSKAQTVLSLPEELRKREVKRIGDQIEKLVYEHQQPVIGAAHSLGGVLFLEAWLALKDPSLVRGLVTAGSPHRMPGIGISERPDTGEFHTIQAKKDKIVHPYFAIHGQEDSQTQVPGGHWTLLSSDEGILAMTSGIVQVAMAEAA